MAPKEDPATHSGDQAEVSTSLSTRDAQAVITHFEQGMEVMRVVTEDSWASLATVSSPSVTTEVGIQEDGNMLASSHSRGSGSRSPRPRLYTPAELGAMDPAIVRDRTSDQSVVRSKQAPAPPPRHLFVKEKEPEVTAKQAKIIKSIKEAARSHERPGRW